MIKLRRFISLTTLAVVAMFASGVQAAGTISHALGDLSARRLTISGTDLPTARGNSVTLGGIVLPVMSRSSTRIVARLPESVGAGTYPPL